MSTMLLLGGHEGGEEGEGVVGAQAGEQGQAGPAAGRPHPHTAVRRATGKQRCTAQCTLPKLQPKMCCQLDLSDYSGHHVLLRSLLLVC